MYHLIGFTQAKFSTHYFLQNVEGHLYRVDEFEGHRFMYEIDDYSFVFTQNVLDQHDEVALQAAMNFPKENLMKLSFTPTFEILGYGKELKSGHEYAEIYCYFLEIEDSCYRFEIETNTMYEVSFATLNGGQNVTTQFSNEELQFISLYCRDVTHIPDYHSPVKMLKYEEPKYLIEKDPSKEFRLVAHTVRNWKRSYDKDIAFRFVRDQDDVLYRMEIKSNFEGELFIVTDEQHGFSEFDVNVTANLENESLHAVIKQPTDTVKRIPYNQNSRSWRPKTPEPNWSAQSDTGFSFANLFSSMNPK